MLWLRDHTEPAHHGRERVHTVAGLGHPGNRSCGVAPLASGLTLTAPRSGGGGAGPIGLGPQCGTWISFGPGAPTTPPSVPVAMPRKLVSMR